MTTTSVTNGQTSTGLTIRSLDILDVEAGGKAVSTVDSGTVNVSGGATLSTSIYGAVEIVYTGGTTTNTFVYSQGSQELSGGTATGTDLISGFQEVFAGGVASGTLAGGATALVGDQVISNGGKAINTHVAQNGEQSISAGGTATGTQVVSNGSLFVYGGTASNVTAVNGTVVVSGGTVAGLTLTSGSQLSISGGTVTGLTLGNNTSIDFQADVYASDAVATYNAASDLLTINEGGHTYTQSVSGTFTNESFFLTSAGAGTLVSVESAIFVSSGVTSTGVTVASGTRLIVLSSGTATSTTVDSGSISYVSSGGLASGTTVSALGSQSVEVGGTARNTLVDSGGSEIVLGTASATNVKNAGHQFVVNGGRASGTVISGGGFQTISSGGTAVSATVLAGGSQTVSSATASGTTVSGASVTSAGVEEVFSGGVANGTIVKSFGTVSAFSGGILSGTVISNLGSTFVYSAVSAVNTTILSGGFEYVSAGGVSIDATISNGGFQVVSGTTAGTQYVSAGVKGIASGTLILAGGILELFSSGVATSTHLGGGALDIEYLPFVAGGSATLNSSTDVLTVKEGASTYTETLAGNYSGFKFHVAEAMDGSTLVTACYCPGTLILTDAGEQLVEALAIGDIIATASGQKRPIRWIGRRSYAGRFLAANPNAQPIRFRGGSLGGGLPCRDLLVSPEHAMFLDGVLVPARCLVNGVTIVQELGLERVDYYHVELDSHDILLAEGAPSESYLDDDSRGIFHNASDFASQYPDAPPPGSFCAPRVTDGYHLDAIRLRLAAVAARMRQAA